MTVPITKAEQDEIDDLLQRKARDFAGSTSQNRDAKLDWLMQAVDVLLRAARKVGEAPHL
jgi:hypothetical protein